MWSVIFIFLSYLDRNFVKGEFLIYPPDAEKESKDMFFMLNSTFCAKMSVIGENYLYQVSDGVEEVRSVHNPAGKLVDCSLTVNQMQVKSFMHVCRLGLKNQTPKLEDLKISFAHIAEAKSNCLAFQRKSEGRKVFEKIATQPVKKQNNEREISGSDEDKVFRRSKRGFTYPGTLWCGAGNMADNYDNLGEFAETDSCCRVHDHCPYVIHAFSTKYGYTNFKWHSICHCDCDNALKACLRKVNDTSSRVVGQAFFNVMEVPCFEFIYEEQCVERHWYGVCKTYGKLPVAVARESIPYDFGGIDVIDVLTLAPPKHKESKKAEEEPTESTVPGSQTTGPEEPSLSNVVTAAEDFIKVLATVSTSQSSTTETVKGETQTSEKKKKKNLGKKKKKSQKRKGKGKGRKKKIRVDSGSKVEEAAPVTPPGSKVEEVIDRSNFVDEPGKNVHLKRNMNDFIDLEGKEEPSNDVMKDEPVVDEENADDVTSITSPSPVKKDQKLTVNTETAPFSTTTSNPTDRRHDTKRQRPRNGRKRQSEISKTFPLEGVATHNATEEGPPIKTTEAASVPSSTPTVTAEQPAQQRLESHSEKGAVTTTANTPIVAALKSKRYRSKEKGGRDKRRRITSTPPTEEVAFGHSTEAAFKATARIGSPTTAVNAAEQLVSRRPDFDRERSSVTTTTTDTSTTTTTSVTTAATSTLSALQNKRQRLKDREGRKRRRKVGLVLLAEVASLQSASEDTIQMLTTTDRTSVLTTPTTATSRPTGQEALHNVGKDGERGRSTSTTGIPIVAARRHGVREREEIKRRKTVPTLFSDGVTLYNDNETDLRTMAAAGLRPATMSSKVDEIEELEPQTPGDSTQQVLNTVQTSTPSMSPISLTLRKVQEQLGRKRRRKARLSYTRQ